MKVALCCIGRLENRYAVEFVEFYGIHHGVDKIFVYDNNYDGEEHFEDVLQPYIDGGLVEIVDFRNKSICQLEAYQDCYDRHGNEYDWICFFDFDEYIGLEKEKTLRDLLLTRIYDNYDVIHINELIFGDGGNVYYENKPLIERFKIPVMPIDFKKTYNFPENCHIKSIVKGGLKNVVWGLTPHTPSNPLNACDAAGNPCKSQSPFVIPYVYKNIMLRHYNTKTIEEFYTVKVKRGYPDGNKDFFKKNSWIDDFFKENVRTPEKEAFIRSVMKIEKINVMIVNYNTPELIDACVQSINKHVKNANIYVFDNSDKRPFINTFGNVTVIDNTKGQVINFEKWLNGYRVKNPMANNYGSAKHCYTIEKFMEMFDDNFVLMDSDVIVKKDFSDIYNDEYIFVGEKIGQYVMWGPRLLPYICFINNKMCKKLGVHFFDDKRMAQLNGDRTNDTGASFLQDASKYPHREIKYNDYINHLAASSWVKKNLEVRFLNPNRHLYEYDGEISIVIPCYNQGKYVAKTIESVKSMAYKDFCCIVVNDGSTDDSEKNILNSIKGDYRFRYFKTENKGVAHARNFGIKQTKSKYILCLDSDDIISKTYVKNAINFLNENDDVSLYYGDALLFYNDGYMKYWKLKEYSYRNLLKMNMIYSACIYRREIYDKIKGYDETLDGYEDWEFLIRYLNVNDNAYKTEELCFYYRRHENSRDHIVHERIKDFAKLIFEKNKEIYKKNNLTINE